MTTQALEHRSFVALSPADVTPAQAQLADWCVHKMRALGRDYLDVLKNVAIAKTQNWKRSHLQTAAAKLKRRIQYYQKIRTAVRAGYLVIPNLPIEIMAVRVNRSRPVWKVGRYPSSVNEIDARHLPVGVGRYVDETTNHQQLASSKDEKGNLIPRVEAGEYDDEIDFPIVLVKPIIMEATARAMSLKVFDQIGVAHGHGTTSAKGRRSDPMVVGQLIDPRSTAYNKKILSFFVAWWLDTDAL